MPLAVISTQTKILIKTTSTATRMVTSKPVLTYTIEADKPQRLSTIDRHAHRTNRPALTKAPSQPLRNNGRVHDASASRTSPCRRESRLCARQIITSGTTCCIRYFPKPGQSAP